VSKPILTAVATTVALGAAVVQYAVPDAVPALRRDPVALAHGQWWRAVTPLLVQTLGWYQVLTNLVTLALVGTSSCPRRRPGCRRTPSST
jgi:hypothetical protein